MKKRIDLTIKDTQDAFFTEIIDMTSSMHFDNLKLWEALKNKDRKINVLLLNKLISLKINNIIYRQWLDNNQQLNEYQKAFFKTYIQDNNTTEMQNEPQYDENTDIYDMFSIFDEHLKQEVLQLIYKLAQTRKFHFNKVVIKEINKNWKYHNLQLSLNNWGKLLDYIRQ